MHIHVGTYSRNGTFRTLGQFEKQALKVFIDVYPHKTTKVVARLSQSWHKVVITGCGQVVTKLLQGWV